VGTKKGPWLWGEEGEARRPRRREEGKISILKELIRERMSRSSPGSRGGRRIERGRKG